jgi:uncharacterized membrane protein
VADEQPFPSILGIDDGESVEGEVVDEDRASAPPQGLIQFLAKSHSGPLPTSEDYARYEMVLPGSAERIMQLAERAMALTEGEAQHRRKVEDDVVGHNVKVESRAQWIASGFGIAGFATAIVFAILGLSVEGLIALIVPLGVFISRFLNRGD